MIFSNEYIAAIHVTSLTLIEIYYLLRRKKSREETRKIVNKLKRILVVVPIHDYIDRIGEIKSQVPISIADCCTIGFAGWNQCSAIFKHENEIDSQLREFQENVFLQRLVFIDDFPIYGILTAKHQKNYSKQNGEERIP